MSVMMMMMMMIQHVFKGLCQRLAGCLCLGLGGISRGLRGDVGQYIFGVSRVLVPSRKDFLGFRV